MSESFTHPLTHSINFVLQKLGENTKQHRIMGKKNDVSKLVYQDPVTEEVTEYSLLYIYYMPVTMAAWVVSGGIRGIGPALDCWSTGQAINPAPGA